MRAVKGGTVEKIAGDAMPPPERPGRGPGQTYNDSSSASLFKPSHFAGKCGRTQICCFAQCHQAGPSSASGDVSIPPLRVMVTSFVSKM